MAKIFDTNPDGLEDLLTRCKSGKLQLPDFQRSWVWDEERIRALIASVAKAFPVGAVMTLATGGKVSFAPRPVEGAEKTATEVPEFLILDGQQRLTSLFRVLLNQTPVETRTPRGKKRDVHFYIDIVKALDADTDIEDAIISVPADRILRTNFNRDVVLDVSDREKEFERLMFPLSMTFDWSNWQTPLITYLNERATFAAKWPKIEAFQKQVIDNFKQYQIPVIKLVKETPLDAVCTVFEKVNTGGKALDAFELVTAVYAAEGYRLRDDWLGDGSPKSGLKERFGRTLVVDDSQDGVLSEIDSTDFLSVISLFHTREVRRQAEEQGKDGKDLPQISGRREMLLQLPLSSYKKWRGEVEAGFVRAAKFLWEMKIYRRLDVPYKSQINALAAIMTELGENRSADGSVRKKLAQWFWCGVFGELYGSTVDTRIANDFVQVPAWLNGGQAPRTVEDAYFSPSRLDTMRTRLSAAYKGVNALLMANGAQDWLSGKAYDSAVFFGESTDIHHIFPRDWCEQNGKSRDTYDSIINKTPIGYRTNRIIGGPAPSEYMADLKIGANERDPVADNDLQSRLASHLIDPDFLTNDDFEAHIERRRSSLVALIEAAMGKSAVEENDQE